MTGRVNPVLGLDVAGTAVALGPGVTRFAEGDEVYGFGRGTFAEYTVAREDKLARKPANLSLEQAAAVPVSAATALQAFDAGRVEAGQSVLVTGPRAGWARQATRQRPRAPHRSHRVGSGDAEHRPDVRLG